MRFSFLSILAAITFISGTKAQATEILPFIPTGEYRAHRYDEYKENFVPFYISKWDGTGRYTLSAVKGSFMGEYARAANEKTMDLIPMKDGQGRIYFRGDAKIIWGKDHPFFVEIYSTPAGLMLKENRPEEVWSDGDNRGAISRNHRFPYEATRYISDKELYEELLSSEKDPKKTLRWQMYKALVSNDIAGFEKALKDGADINSLDIHESSLLEFIATKINRDSIEKILSILKANGMDVLNDKKLLDSFTSSFFYNVSRSEFPGFSDSVDALLVQLIDTKSRISSLDGEAFSLLKLGIVTSNPKILDTAIPLVEAYKIDEKWKKERLEELYAIAAKRLLGDSSWLPYTDTNGPKYERLLEVESRVAALVAPDQRTLAVYRSIQRKNQLAPALETVLKKCDPKTLESVFDGAMIWENKPALEKIYPLVSQEKQQSALETLSRYVSDKPEYVEMVKYLLPNASAEQRAKAFLLAAARGSNEVAKLIAEPGLDLKGVRTKDGHSWLSVLVKGGEVERAKAEIDAGADVKGVFQFGYSLTQLTVGLTGKRKAMLEMLLAAKANPNQLNTDGQSLLDLYSVELSYRTDKGTKLDYSDKNVQELIEIYRWLGTKGAVLVKEKSPFVGVLAAPAPQPVAQQPVYSQPQPYYPPYSQPAPGGRRRR